MFNRRSLSLATLLAAVLALAAAAFALLFLNSGGLPVAAATPVYADGAGTCAGLLPCYTTIQEAVDNVDAGGTVNVFPGTYAENVDLGGAAGGLSLVAVDAAGAPAPGTVTIAPASGRAIDTTVANSGDVTLNGLVLESPDDDGLHLESVNATLTNVTASNNGDNGIFVDASAGITVTDSTANDNSGGADPGFELLAGGDVTVSGSTANGNSEGFLIEGDGVVTITDSTADDNGSAFDVTGIDGVTMTGLSASNNIDEGIQPKSDGTVTVADSFATGTGDDGIDIETEGSTTITNSTSTLSGDNGVEIDAGGDVVIDGLSSTNNGAAESGDGINVNSSPFEDSVDGFAITNSLVAGNDDEAIDFDPFFEAEGPYAATGNIICQNSGGGYDSPDEDVSVDGTGNWWGTASGPTHPNNPTGTGDEVRDSANGNAGTFDFDPWIDTISGSGDPAVVGLPVVVSFEFTGGAGAVAFQEGPGDPNGDPTFTASTDNGTVSTSGFVSGGKLEVALTAATVGSATVTVTGPCGLDDTLGGNSVTLDVAAAPVGPTPTPAQLPPTGTQPVSSGGSGLTLALALAAGALALLGAGGALAVARKR